MLELRPTCEHCNTPLPPNSLEARICTYECTFCAACVESVLGNVCPNCGGGFVPRPIRPSQNWTVTTSWARTPRAPESGTGLSMRQLTPTSPRESERFRRSGASRAFRATGLVPRFGLDCRCATSRRRGRLPRLSPGRPRQRSCFLKRASFDRRPQRRR
jgi:hypothetical protein